MTKNEPTAHQLAESSLLAPNGIDEEVLERVFAAVRAHRADDADLFFQLSRAESWMLEEGEVKSGSFAIDQGVGVRVVSGEKTAFASADDISPASLEAAPRVTRAIAAQGGDASAPAATPRSARPLYAPVDPVSAPDDAEKVRLLERLERRARAADPRVKRVIGRLSGEYEVVFVARADGALREAGVPDTEFRAAVIVGAGSLSFEMIRYLTERVPVMICPRWVYTRVQPIAIRNVLDYLVAALDTPESAGQVVEIGGADVVTYGETMTGYARARGLRRWLVPVPVLTPRLSSL